MCAAHGKKVADWFRNQEVIELLNVLANDLGIKSNDANSRLSSATSISATYPQLVTVRKGSPENGGGVWLHPDLAIQLAQWCNPFFAIQVSRWAREWLTILEQNRRAKDKMQQPQSEHEKASNVFSEESAFFLLESTEPFPVDLDDAIEWWDCRTKDGKPLLRHNLVRKLKTNYYEGVNYHLIKNDRW